MDQYNKERAILGAMMVEYEAIEVAMVELSPEDFSDPCHRYIYEAIVHLMEAHTPVDIITVANQLKDEGHLMAVGGAVVLTDMTTYAMACGYHSHPNKYIKR